MDSPATTQDVEQRWRPLSPAEQLVAAALLADAWADVTTQVPSVPARVEANPTFRRVVVSILVAMVLRVLKNPDGIRQMSIDDYQVTIDSTRSSGSLYLADDERNRLLEVAQALPGIYSVPLGVPYWGP